jgi:hypothetical protein
VSELAIPMSKAIGSVTLHVRITGVRIAALRIKAGTLLLKFAAFVMGTQIEIHMGGDFDELPPQGRRSYDFIEGREIPRQLSVRAGSPLYVSNFFDFGQKIDVFLDGEKQKQVVSYDADAGYVRVNKLNADGKPFIVGDEVETEIRRGRVELRPRA